MTYPFMSGLDFVLNTISHKIPSRFFILGKTITPLSPHLKDKAWKQGCIFINWSYGEQGSIFLLTNHIDVAQSKEMIVLKLGFARSLSLEPLNARQLLEQRIVTPQEVNHEAIHGNVSVACVSQQLPSFCLYQNLTSVSQIYHWEGQDTIIFSDTIRLLIRMIPTLELNQEAVPHHFLYRSVFGKMTYINNVHKIRSGHIAKFEKNQLRIKQLESLDDWIPKERINKVSSLFINHFDTRAECIIGSYVQEVFRSGHDLLVLLSGGVDSSLLTSYVQTNLPSQHKLKSVSYTIETQEFDTEIEYAQQAINIFETEHQFLSVLAKNYISLLEQLIDLTAHPVDCEQDPCYLAIAKSYFGSQQRYLFAGSALDTLLGYDNAKRLLQVERFGKIPQSQHALSLLGRILNKVLPNKAFGLRETAFLIQSLKDRRSPYHPVNREYLFTNLDRIRYCFDSQAISKAIDHRLADFEVFSDSQNLLEKIHFIGFTHIVHEQRAITNQVFRAHDLEFVTPYLDSEFVRAVIAFHPNIRYFAMGRQKWLPKALIEKRLSNGRQITQKSKRAGGFDNELRKWMKSGILRELVHDIQRPGYMTLSDFEKTIEEPDWFTWNLLTLDLFQKRILKV
jgi:asparagine synthetase B (glutamine-hydrolysing)